MKALLLVLFLPGLSVLSKGFQNEYHYVGMLKTFWEARQYCRKMFSDLATIRHQGDNDRLVSVLPQREKNVWIGLFDDMNTWRWKHGMGYFRNNKDFKNWVPGQPTRGSHYYSCVTMEANGHWKSHNCRATFPAVCLNKQGPSYIVVNTKTIWSRSNDICVANYTAFARVMNATDNRNIASLLSTTAWIGLFKHHWGQWSDGTHRKFTNWDSNYNYMQGGESLCATLNATTGTWKAFNCENKFHFVCQKIYQRERLRLKLKFETEADLQDPAVQQQMLQQLHAKMKKNGMPDFKLRWIQTGGQTCHKEKTEREEGSCT